MKATKRDIRIRARYFTDLQRCLLHEIEREIQIYAHLRPAIKAAALPDLYPWLMATWLILKHGCANDVFAALAQKHRADVIERVIRCGGLFDSQGDWVELAI